MQRLPYILYDLNVAAMAAMAWLFLICAQVILPHSADVKIEGASIGARWLVVRQRSRAQQSVVLHQLAKDGSMPQQLAEGQVVQFEEAAYALSGGGCWVSAAHAGLFVHMPGQADVHRHVQCCFVK
jgi:hypothetical protein